MTNGLAWIAVDWGTSNLRAWGIDAAGSVVFARGSDKGMGKLAPGDFEAALLEVCADDLPADGTVPVIICGMAGARQGWTEAPYVAAPCTPPGLALAAKPQVQDPRLDVHILPGVKQDDPADVMRGEETQVAGVLAAQPQFDGVLCLPGTHTKWAHISAGEIVGFRTVMTGEIFALLSGQSVLRHSVTGDGWDDDAFDAALSDALSSPQQFGARLFGLRATGLLEGTDPGTLKARLSGQLLGLELAGTRPYWLGREVIIVGAPRLAALYRRALEAQGVMVRIAENDTVTLDGLKAAYAASAN